MTIEEELARYIEDRSMLEQDAEAMNEIMKHLESESDDYESRDEWNYAWDELTSIENELASIESAIKDLMDRS